MGINIISMKTIYEKTTKLCEYVIDLVYMQYFHMQIFDEVNEKYFKGEFIPIAESLNNIRSFLFTCCRPESLMFSSIKYSNIDNNDKLMTITSSKPHVTNNTSGRGVKYNFVLEYNSLNVLDSLKNLHHMLVSGIENDTIQETEFQTQMLYPDERIKSVYMYILLNDILSKIVPEDGRYENPILCLGSTDVLRFIPAKKAYVELLDKKVGNKYDWRSEIHQRYGHIIK